MMAATTGAAKRRYRGESGEDRRAARRERLLDAGFDLLGSEGYAGTTVRGVCERARLTPRYFYESFADLDELLVAVFDRLIAELSADVLGALAAAPDDPQAKARASIAALVHNLTDDPRRARVAFVEGFGSEPLMRRRFDAMHLFSGLLATEGSAFYGIEPGSDPLVDLTSSVLVGGMAELLIAWLDGNLAIDRGELIDDYTELFVATGETAVAMARRRARPSERRGR